MLSNRITFHAIFTLITRAYLVLATRYEDLALSWSYENKTDKEEKNKRIRECQTIFYYPFFHDDISLYIFQYTCFTFEFHLESTSLLQIKFHNNSRFPNFKIESNKRWTSVRFLSPSRRRTEHEGEEERGRGQRSEGSPVRRYTFGSFHSDFY